MTSRGLRILVMCFCLLATMAVEVVVETSPASATTRPTLDRPRLKAETVVLKGSAPARAKVRIVRRTQDGWKRIGTDRVNRRGRYRLVVDRPDQKKWIVRAVSKGERSRRRKIAPVTPVTPPADESPQTEVLPVAEPPADDACGSRLQKADGTWWECSFVDEFEGTELDLTRWLVQDTAFSGMTNGPDVCIRNEPWTVAVNEGTLRLSAQRLDEPFTCENPYGDFTAERVGASIGTRDRFSQAYGRFAFRAKMPDVAGPGAHSALWLYPSRHTYGQWPRSGEIDVAEWFSGVPDTVFPSVHYLGELTNTHTGFDGRIPDPSEFHTYAVEWSPTTLRFLYDGRLVFEHSWTPLAPLVGSQPFDQPFDVVLSQGWGQLWNAPTSDTPDRFTMQVDWVRVWK